MSTVHRDRVDVDAGVLGALGVGGAVLGGTSGQVVLSPLGFPGIAGFAVGAGSALLVILGTRSISLRLAARTVVALGAVSQLRLAVLGDTLLTGSQGTLAWVVTSAVVLVLADRVGTGAPAMRSWDAPPDRGSFARSTALTVVVLLGMVLLLTPLLLPLVSDAARSGQGPRLDATDDGGLTIRASDTLDMTTRPDLTDDVVFTVDSNRGTFWRGQTYDEWDGRHWVQTRPQRLPLRDGDAVVSSREDLGATGSDVVTQRYRMEAAYSEVVFAAASPVSIESRRPVLQGGDSTLVTAGVAMGRDTTYTVVSRRHVLDEQVLRAATGPVPEGVRDRYAQAPVATDRVLEAAREATVGAETTYDKVRALERWMGERTEYSLDAPLSPRGVDVVDHFLFESRLGWCEQVASSLVVMARANGVPARLVTGYVPGEVDRLTGTYVVRGRDAHAWAEVWFPELGWVPFDPTASVPLAGADQVDRSLGQWILDHLVVLLVGGVAVALVGFGALQLVRRLRHRRRHAPVGWVEETDHRLVALGRRAEWPRSDAETASTYAASLARHVRDERLVQVGAAIDQALYAPSGPDELTRVQVDEILATVTLEPPDRRADPGSGNDVRPG